MKQLILLRGLPGSGKTTLAKFLENGLADCVAISADDYFTNTRTGDYNFDINKLHLAHEYCRIHTRSAMVIDTESIVVHNTNTTSKEMKPYFDLAEEFGYNVVSLVVENRHGSENIHSVPEDTLLKMKERFNVKLI